MSKNESEKYHFTHLIVALGFMLYQAYSTTKGFFKSLETSPTTHPCQDQQDQPHFVIDIPTYVLPPSSEYITTQEYQDQPPCGLDIPTTNPPPPTSATQDPGDQPRRPYYVPDAPAGLPTSSVSGSIQHDYNHTVVAPPNATNNPIWKQIVVQNLGAVVLALAAAVFSQYKDLTDIKDGWVAVTLLFGVAAIWNGLLFRRMYPMIASMMEIIGMVFVFAALSRLACLFTPQINKHSIIPWLFCASMCLPILYSVMTDFLKM